jgi:sensor histidine kinase regulating citrate/malate metabolism
MKGSYAKRYCPLGFEAVGSPTAQAARVVANDYFLRLIFWNLWLNSHQAVGSTCKITVEFAVEGEKLRLVFLDSGAGFRQDAVGVAFQDRFSKHGEHRGRGLLEVQDAVEQLHGSAELVRHASGTYRVALLFPVASP